MEREGVRANLQTHLATGAWPPRLDAAASERPPPERTAHHVRGGFATRAATADMTGSATKRSTVMR
jgi:hypothetical protein